MVTDERGFPKVKVESQSSSASESSDDDDRKPKMSTKSKATIEIEEALEDLQLTVTQAETYAKGERVIPERLKIYTRAINEDCSQVEAWKNKGESEEIAKKASAACKAARRLRRELEHTAADMISEKNSLESTRDENESNKYKDMGLKVPSIKIAPFKGDESKWQSFIDVFQQIIGNNPNMNDVAKLTHLKMSLEGKPRELIEDLPDAGATYKTAVATLQKTYGGRKKAVIRIYQKLQDLAPAGTDKQSLRWTFAKVTNIVESLRQMKRGDKELDEEYLSAIIFGKFPEEMVTKITEADDEEDESLSLDAALKALDKMIRAKENVARVTQFTGSAKSSSSTKEKAASSSSGGASASSHGPSTTAASSERGGKDRSSRRSNNGPRKKCPFDGGDHWADECEKYPDLESRKAQLNDRCPKCIKKSHPGESCKVERDCHWCDGKDHNRALCPKRFGKKKESTMLGFEKPRTRRKEVPEPGGGEFLTFCLKLQTRKNPEGLVVRAVIDSASSSTMVTRRVVDELQLEKWRIGARTFRLLGNKAIKRRAASASKLWLHPPESEEIEAAAYVVENIVEDLPTADVTEFRQKYPQFSEYAIPETGAGQPIDLLIGTDVLAYVLTLEKSVRVDRATQLISTLYGWMILAAPTAKSNGEPETAMFLQAENSIKTLFELEAVGLRDVEQKDAEMEESTLKSFYESVRRVDDRYEVSWPWAHYPPPLPENFGLALGRLRSLQRKLRGRPELLAEYDRIIRAQEEEGIVEVVNAREKKGPVVHYIPHHPVISPDKSTKVRLVYDGSAKSSPKSLCLNDVILKGKRWLSDVVTMLLRFRKNELAVVADIAKAFHQIAIREQDRDAVRFLWLKDPAKEATGDNLVTYRFKRMAFGIIASPFLLYATISHHLTSEEPKVAQLIADHMYADNFMASVTRSTSLVETYRNVKAVFQRMGMHLTKWATNDPTLLAAIEEGEESEGIRQSVLGVVWQTEKDQFSLKAPKVLADVAPTKRIVLKQTASYFDPLGFAAPVLLKAKIFLRELWNAGYSWDQQLPEREALVWQQLRGALAETSAVLLPRQIATLSCDDPDTIVQMHVFTDASEKALGVVVYLRLQKEEAVSMGIVIAKSRLAPKNILSMPRLELVAALMGTRFVKYVKDAMHLEKEVKVYLWCDNKCALTWISSHKLLATVLERQVREIREFRYEQIRYVPTKQNPADPASRGATVQELREQQWWSGPDWLLKEESWPENTFYGADEENPTREEFALFIGEEENGGHIVAAPNPAIDSPFGIRIEDCSSLHQLLRRTATCFEAIRRFRKGNFAVRTPLDHHFAKQHWIRWAQRSNFGKGVPKIPRIDTFVDAAGIVRCKSRMKYAAIGENAKEPILLPPKAYLTRLIILDLHERNMHAGSSHTLAALRRSYWIQGGRRLVFTVVTRGCQSCRVKSRRPFAPPEMPPLPASRVGAKERPFAATGLDIFGPLTVKEGNSANKVKVWVMLCTCLRIRAVHLEVLYDMKSQEFLLAFRKFVARRGVPEYILTDNAPQFHAINGRFQQLWRVLEKDSQSYFAEKGITWKFVPEKAAWMGGAYERLVGTVKRALERTYGDVMLPKRHLEVIMAEVEAVVNSRPLTYVDRELETPIITPASFLQAKYSALPLDFEKLDRVDAKQSHWKLWKASEELLTQFWRNWSRFYLHELRERKDRLGQAYRQENRRPKPGEIVVVAEENKKQNLWQKAVIERLIESEDGEIRTAQIRLPKRSRTFRPITQLIPLDLAMELPANMGQLNAQGTAIIHPESSQAESSDVPPSAHSLEIQSEEEPLVVELGLDGVDVSFNSV